MINRIGEQRENSYGSLMTIIEYKNNQDITVQFKNGYKSKNRAYKEFNKGAISNPYDKTVYKIGFLGEGRYKTKDSNNKNTIQYTYWCNMVKRCYDEKELEKHPTYIGCTVCEEWMCFQTFAKWFDENYYECEPDIMCLDKDILVKGNKIYSPNTSVLVPKRINSLFTKRQNYRGDYPIGVGYHKGKIRAYCNIFEDGKFKQKHLGYFNTLNDAFYKGYKPFKEDYIKEVANDYKDKIPQNLYKAMMNYVVEITD